jgi:hypothetical protein
LKASASFLKKRSKKLLIIRGWGVAGRLRGVRIGSLVRLAMRSGITTSRFSGLAVRPRQRSKKVFAIFLKK